MAVACHPSLRTEPADLRHFLWGRRLWSAEAKKRGIHWCFCILNTTKFFGLGLAQKLPQPFCCGSVSSRSEECGFAAGRGLSFHFQIAINEKAGRLLRDLPQPAPNGTNSRPCI